MNVQKSSSYFGLTDLEVQPDYSIKRIMSFVSSAESKSGGRGDFLIHTSILPPQKDHSS